MLGQGFSLLLPQFYLLSEYQPQIDLPLFPSHPLPSDQNVCQALCMSMSTHPRLSARADDTCDSSSQPLLSLQESLHRQSFPCISGLETPVWLSGMRFWRMRSIQLLPRCLMQEGSWTRMAQSSVKSRATLTWAEGALLRTLLNRETLGMRCEWPAMHCVLYLSSLTLVGPHLNVHMLTTGPV